jgi:hypothetical protein
MQREMTIRICQSCEKPLNFKPDGTQEGVYCCDEYFHEGDCLDQSFDDAWRNDDGSRLTWEQHYHQQDGSCYFTEWEPEFAEEVTA